MTAFCTDLSRAAGEPLPGTGAHQSRILLIRWPKGGWGKNLAVAPDMPSEVAEAIEAVRAGGWRVNLIDRKGEPQGAHRLFLYPDELSRSVPARDLAATIHDMRAGGRAAWEPQVRPVLTVCTHGKKDRCCAKFGFVAYKRLAAQAGPDGPEIWESTHLGGCRFSGSALALPGLRKYGRIAPEDASALLADEAAGRAWLPGWRGPSHLEPEAQAVAHAAETWAREKGGALADDPVRSGNVWTVKVRTANGAQALDLRTEARRHMRPGTCDDLDAGDIGENSSWRITIGQTGGR